MWVWLYSKSTGGVGPYSKSTWGEWGHTTWVHERSGAIHQEYMRGVGPYSKNTWLSGAIQEYMMWVGPYSKSTWGEWGPYSKSTWGEGPYSKSTWGFRSYSKSTWGEWAIQEEYMMEWGHTARVHEGSGPYRKSTWAEWGHTTWGEWSRKLIDWGRGPANIELTAGQVQNWINCWGRGSCKPILPSLPS